MSILTPTKPSRFPDGAFYGMTPEQVAERLDFRDVFDEGQSYGVSAIAEKLGVEEIIIRRKFWERRPDRQSWVVPDVRGRGDYYPTIFGGSLVAWLETEPRGTFTVSPDAALMFLREHPELQRAPDDCCDLLELSKRRAETARAEHEAEEKAVAAEERARQWDRLAEVLSRFDRPRPEDAAMLPDLMNDLALTDNQLRSFATTYRKAAALLAEQSQAAERLAAARKAHGERRATFKAEHGERIQELERARAKYAKLQAEYDRDFAGDLAEIRRAAGTVQAAEAEVGDRRRLERVRSYASRCPFLFAGEPGPDGYPRLRHPLA